MNKIYSTLLLLLLSLFLLTNTAFAAKQITYCTEASPVYFIPSLVNDTASFDVIEALYDPLVNTKQASTELAPSLATSWKISKDGKVYTFHLRKGVKFHTTKYFKPTRDFNADDVLFTFDMQRNKKNPFHKVGSSIFNFYSSVGFETLIKSIKKVDAYTVQFTLAHAEAPFLAELSIDSFSIVSKEYADQILAQKKDIMTLSNQPIGTGAFSFYSYKKDSMLRMVSFKDYWNGKADADRLIFEIVPNTATRTVQIQKGDCDIIALPNPADVPKLKQDPNIVVQTVTGVNTGYLGINAAKKPFNNKLVRQALSYAVDKEALLKSVYRGYAKEADNLLPPTIWGYNANIAKYKFNLKKAKALLTKAGYPHGFSLHLWAMPIARAYMPNARRAAEIIQADWKKIGVNVKIISYEWGEYIHKLNQDTNEKDVFFIGWTAAISDPDYFFNLLSCKAANGGNNFGNYCNKQFDSLLYKAKQTPNRKIRSRYYAKVQTILAKDVGVIPLAHALVIEVSRKRISNFKPDPTAKKWFSLMKVK